MIFSLGSIVANGRREGQHSSDHAPHRQTMCGTPLDKTTRRRHVI
jgi:hypothetical protein